METQRPNHRAISNERRDFLLSLSSQQRIQILMGHTVPEAGEITGLERQFIRAHLTDRENQILWLLM
jgi:hypothetical protein